MFAEQIARAQEMMDSFYLQQQKTVEMLSLIHILLLKRDTIKP